MMKTISEQTRLDRITHDHCL